MELELGKGKSMGKGKCRVWLPMSVVPGLWDTEVGGEVRLGTEVQGQPRQCSESLSHTKIMRRLL